MNQDVSVGSARARLGQGIRAGRKLRLQTCLRKFRRLGQASLVAWLRPAWRSKLRGRDDDDALTCWHVVLADEGSATNPGAASLNF
ncbi:MAG TPA: hypothetical protein PLB25_09955 [Rhodoferax sp.]|nr:hypothetical protein [Rhodoferax sp.]